MATSQTSGFNLFVTIAAVVAGGILITAKQRRPWVALAGSLASCASAPRRPDPRHASGCEAVGSCQRPRLARSEPKHARLRLEHVLQQRPAIRLVQSLYAAGASSVILAGIHGEPWRLREEGGPIADTLFVKLPADAATAQAVARAVVRSSDRPDEFSSVLDHKKIVTASELPHIGRRERAITPEDVRGGQTLRLWWD